jgi:hypothetical protein
MEPLSISLPLISETTDFPAVLDRENLLRS